MSIACVRHVLFLGLAVCLVPSVRAADEREAANTPQFVDLSLLVGEDYPSTWPAKFPKFQLHSYQRPGPLSPYHAETLLMDPNTGTQMDVPPHSIPKPDSGLPNAGPAGLMFSEQVPAWQFCGNACVVDCSDLLPKCRIGQSALITKDRVLQWEKEHRELGPGDVVLFRSGYSDKYYGPLPEGRRQPGRIRMSTAWPISPAGESSSLGQTVPVWAPCRRNSPSRPMSRVLSMG
jgi:kynurenine formamidase